MGHFKDQVLTFPKMPSFFAEQLLKEVNAKKLNVVQEQQCEVKV